MTRSATFWERRRAAVRAEAEAETAAQAAAAEAAEQAAQQQALAEKTDAEVLAELGLPDPDSLTKGDDFAAFMARAVPEHLRKRALRRLWRSDPVLACVDGLNDYDDDYLTGSTGNGPLQTSYKVGKGLLAHVLDTGVQARPEGGDADTLDNDAIMSDDEAMEDVAATTQTATPHPAHDRADDQAPAPAPHRPRRMTFHFDGNSA